MTSGDAIRQTLDALSESKIHHMVTGGLAANAHGIARSTKAADIVIHVEGNAFKEFSQKLPPGLKLDLQITFETITGSRRHIIEVTGSAFRIELFLLGTDPHHQERFQRRKQKYLADIEHETWVATAEDMIIQKLRWNRDKDRDDARNIIGVQGDALDWPYIESWCDRHGTRERLEEIRRSIPAE